MTQQDENLKIKDGGSRPVDAIIIAHRRVADNFKLRYGVELDDLEISEVPGYWHDKTAKHHKGHPLHSCIGCDAPFKATYAYFDNIKGVDGKFQSPHKTWMLLKEAQ
jgi:hypothetical protein